MMLQRTWRCAAVFPSLPKAFCSPRLAKSEIWHQWGATSCNVRVVPTFATKMISPATNDDPVPAVRLAMVGRIRLHAIFGWSDECVATNPSDLAVALAALDANVIVRGPEGQRSITFTEFQRLPGNTPEHDNVLERGDLIISIEVPPRIEGRASHYFKVRDRQSYEFALVSTAAAVAMDGGRIRSARVAMGGVAHKPWRLTAAEAALRGVSLADIEVLKKAIAISFIDARPLAQNGFKAELGQRVALRALQVAGGRA